MKTHFTPHLFFTLLCVMFAAELRAQTSAFTYQGRLTDNGSPVNGFFDITFSVWSNSSGPAQVGNTITNLAVPVSDGLFTATLNFGAGTFPGADRWLEIGVRTNGGGVFSSLVPRQQLTATPYALTASNLTGTLPASQLTGTLPSAQLSGIYSGAVTFSNAANSFTGNGAGLSSLNGANISADSITASQIAASAVTSSEIANGTIVNADISAAAAVADTKLATISTAGKVANSATTANSANSASAIVARDASGNFNAGAITATSFAGDGAGLTNVNAGSLGGLSAADFWQLGGNAGTTPGAHFLGTTDNQPLQLKVNNQVGLRLEYPTLGAVPNVVGGYSGNTAGSGTEGAVIGGGGGSGIANMIESNADYGVIGGGQGNILHLGANHGTIAGGYQNQIGTNADFATIAGGGTNSISVNADFATISGGSLNSIESTAYHSTIGGGLENLIGGSSGNATIGGGQFNRLEWQTDYAVIAGGYGNLVRTNSASGVISGGNQNIIERDSGYATIGGGDQNAIQTNAAGSTVGGGYLNSVSANTPYATIGGGRLGSISGDYGTVGGGQGNTIQVAADWSTVGGGSLNTISNGADYAFIGGGANNTIRANGDYSTIPGGQDNAAAAFAFAAGRHAKANHQGAFVWADSQDYEFATTASDQFLVRAAGGVRFETGGTGFMVDGVTITGSNIGPSQLSGTYPNAVSFPNAANSFSGNGSELTALNASQLTSGTVADARLSANVALLNRSPQAFVGTNTFAGWLGVGTTNPLGEIHIVNDGVQISASALENDEIIVAAADATLGLYSTAAGNFSSAIALKEVLGDGTVKDNWGLVRKTSGASSDFLITYGTNDNYAVNPPLVTIRTNGNVGIGTVSPARTLDVAGEVVINNNVAYAARDSLGTVRQMLLKSTANETQLATASGEDIIFKDGSDLNMVIKGAGDVGIGTTTPAARLDVRQNGGTALYVEQSGTGSVWGVYATSYSSNGTAIAASASGGGNQTAIRGETDGTAGWAGYFLGRGHFSGDVGIGTASPAARLDVRQSGGTALSVDQSGGGTVEGIRATTYSANGKAIIATASGGGDQTAIYGETAGTAGWAGYFDGRGYFSGNVGIGITNPTNKLHVAGGVSATAFVTTSDRNAKENFAPVAPQEVLSKVAALPITTWNFKDLKDGRHMGPMAQDFHAAFGLGGGDTTITSIDPDGVALAAIQGLNQKLECQRSLLEQKETEITELKARLEKIEQLLNHKVNRGAK